MAKQNDLAVETTSAQLGYFFLGSEPATEEPVAPAEDKTGTGSATKRPRQPNSGTARSDTHVRVHADTKVYMYQALQAYRLATGKNVSLSEFLSTCIRRALPHISKEAGDILRQARGE